MVLKEFGLEISVLPREEMRACDQTFCVVCDALGTILLSD